MTLFPGFPRVLSLPFFIQNEMKYFFLVLTCSLPGSLGREGMGLSDGQRALHPWVAQGTVPAPDALPDLQLQATLTPPPIPRPSPPSCPFPLSFCARPCRGRGFGPPRHPVPGFEWPLVTPTMGPPHLPAKNMPCPQPRSPENRACMSALPSPPLRGRAPWGASVL